MTEQCETQVLGGQISQVKPSCKGRLPLPNAGLILTPDPLNSRVHQFCANLPIFLLGPLFEGLKELEEVILPELMGDVHQNLLLH